MSRAPVTLTIPAGIIEQLDTLAEQEYRSRSSLATALIAEGLERRNASSKQEAESEVSA